MPRAHIPSYRVSSKAAFFVLFLVVAHPSGLRADQPHEILDEDERAAMEGIGKLAELLQGLQGLSATGRTLSSSNSMGSLGGLADLGGQNGLAGLLRGGALSKMLGGAKAGDHPFAKMAHDMMGKAFPSMSGGIGNVHPGILTLFRSGNATDNVFRQSSNANNGWFGNDILNITDWASRIPTATQMIEFIRDPVGSLAPEPLSPDVQAMLASNQAEAVFILSLLSAIFNLVSSIFFIVSGGLGTLAASLGLIPATLGVVTVPLGVALSTDALLLTVSGNMAARREDWNQKIYKAWTNALARLANSLANLNDGPLRAQLAQYRKQLQEAADVLQTAYQRNYTQRFQAQFPVAAQVVGAARARGATIRG